MKRIQKEISDIAMFPPEPGMIAKYANTSDTTHIIATIIGPKNSPYEGGKFALEVLIPQSYPFQPPRVKFLTRIFHCNISSYGDICLDLLKDQWSPTLTLSKMLLAIITLLSNPNPNDPLTPHAADMYKRNREEHDKIAREWTQLYAN